MLESPINKLRGSRLSKTQENSQGPRQGTNPASLHKLILTLTTKIRLHISSLSSLLVYHLTAPLLTTLITPLLAKADNPIIQTIYTADPAPLVYNNRIYLFTGHDEDGSTGYNMHDWRLFSTSDMVNWQHHPSPMSLATTFPWANVNAWAGQVIPRNGKFYFYVPVNHAATNKMAIGVGVSENVEGPYVDAIGGPLLENAEIDPTVFIDDDGQAYLYWGNPNLWYVALNEDMVSYSGNITSIPLTVSGFGPRTKPTNVRPTAFEEAPWVYKRNGTYYMIYAANCCPEDIRYATAPTALGPWTYRGVVMAPAGESGTNHPGIVTFRGREYFFYHNSGLPGGSGFTRSVAVEEFVYGDDGSIPELEMTEAGVEQVHWLNPYRRQEAETVAWAGGVETGEAADAEGGVFVTQIGDGDYIKVKGVAFRRRAGLFRARVTSALTDETDSAGTIEIRLDSLDGTVVGVCKVPGTGGEWVVVESPVKGTTGIHDLYFKFTGEGEDLFGFDWWQFA